MRNLASTTTLPSRHSDDVPFRLLHFLMIIFLTTLDIHRQWEFLAAWSTFHKITIEDYTQWTQNRHSHSLWVEINIHFHAGNRTRFRWICSRARCASNTAKYFLIIFKVTFFTYWVSINYCRRVLVIDLKNVQSLHFAMQVSHLTSKTTISPPYGQDTNRRHPGCESHVVGRHAYWSSIFVSLRENIVIKTPPLLYSGDSLCPWTRKRVEGEGGWNLLLWRLSPQEVEDSAPHVLLLIKLFAGLVQC